MKILSEELNTHILIFEYPSYGLCQGLVDINKTTVNNHAERAYSFVHETLHWPTDRILIYGHSIGTGPACHIASTKPVGGLILQSPYKSIQNVITGIIGFPGYLFDNSYWNNLETMKYIHCPTLFIHGERDNLIPSEHSKTLYNSLDHNENKQIILLPNDDHNSISYQMSSSCVKSFLKQFLPPSNQLLPEINIDPEFRVPTETIQTSSSTFSYNPFTSLFNLSTASINATQSVYNSIFSNQYNNQ
jgi:esterase/lipase